MIELLNSILSLEICYQFSSSRNNQLILNYGTDILVAFTVKSYSFFRIAIHPARKLIIISVADFFTIYAIVIN